ncbi:hypothetical protein TNCV_1142081 [Trichonephila clavipes]|nr:hypothetical protein TNCV_1142081 [Trichonephila clavipes]
MQDRKCRSFELWRKKREKEQKQKHINGAENILLKDCTKTVLEISIGTRLAGLTAALYGIPHILEGSWHVTNPLSNYRYSSDEALN